MALRLINWRQNMAGQIIKRGGNAWTVRIFLGRDVSGKRKYFNKTIRGTKKDAEMYLTAKLREKDLGVFIEPASIPLDEYLDGWLTDVAKPRLRERTLDSYEGVLNLYITPRLGTKRLCDLGAPEIQKVYKQDAIVWTIPTNRSVRSYNSLFCLKTCR